MDLKYFRERSSLITECELALVSEAAHLLVFGGQGDGEGGFDGEKLTESDAFFECYEKAKADIFAEIKKTDVPQISESFVKEAGRREDFFLSLWLCSEICRYMAKGKRPVIQGDFFEEEKKPENLRVAYVRNVLSDKIFDFINKIVPGLGVVYPGSFTAACEEVYDGRCDFCLLPVETSSEGELRGFRMLREKYELYTVMTVPASIENADGSQNVTRFALYAKSPMTLKTDVKTGADFSVYLKIEISSQDGRAVSEVIEAAEICGLHYVRGESVPLSWAVGRYKSVLTFDVTGKDVCAFLLFLFCEVPEGEAIEIYADFPAI